jgi:hypothetical protein
MLPQTHDGFVLKIIYLQKAKETRSQFCGLNQPWVPQVPILGPGIAPT